MPGFAVVVGLGIMRFATMIIAPVSMMRIIQRRNAMPKTYTLPSGRKLTVSVDKAPKKEQPQDRPVTVTKKKADK